MGVGISYKATQIPLSLIIFDLSIVIKMVSRGVWSLYKVNLRFCKHGGSSKGVRDLLET